MKRSHECPKCKSQKIIEDVRAVDFAQSSKGDLSLESYEKPDAILFKGTHTTYVRAWVCSACGFTEFYASDPEKLILKDDSRKGV